MSKINYNIRLSEEHIQALTDYRERTGIAVTDAIRQSIEEFLERRENDRR